MLEVPGRPFVEWPAHASQRPAKMFAANATRAESRNARLGRPCSATLGANQSIVAHMGKRTSALRLGRGAPDDAHVSDESTSPVYVASPTPATWRPMPWQIVVNSLLFGIAGLKPTCCPVLK